MSWSPPQVQEEMAQEPPRPLDNLDKEMMAARLGPELSRLLGTRVSVRTTKSEDNTLDTPLVTLTSIVADLGSTVNIALGDEIVGVIIERMFGARMVPEPAAAAKAARSLAPGTATWMTASRLLATLLITAMGEGGIIVRRRPVFPLRVASAPSPVGAQTVTFKIEFDQLTSWLRVAAWPAPEEEEEKDTEAELQRWRKRAEQGTQLVPLEVALRLPERRMPLAKALALRPGDILPLERPRILTLIVDGQPMASLPADRFLNMMGDPE